LSNKINIKFPKDFPSFIVFYCTKHPNFFKVTENSVIFIEAKILYNKNERNELSYVLLKCRSLSGRTKKI